MIVIVGMSEIPRIPLKLAFLQGCETLVEGSWTAECQYALPQGIDKTYKIFMELVSSIHVISTSKVEVNVPWNMCPFYPSMELL